MERQTTLEVSKQNAAFKKAPSRLKELYGRFKKSLDISMLVSLITSLAMIIIGAVKVYDCPVNEKIPIFLIVLGTVHVLSALVTWFRNTIASWKLIKVSTIITTIYTLELAFFIYGSYWVYKVYRPSFNPENHGKYCDKTVYMFAFIYITICYVMILIFVIGVLCFVGSVYMCEKWMSKIEEDEESEEGNIEFDKATTVQKQPTPV